MNTSFVIRGLTASLRFCLSAALIFLTTTSACKAAPAGVGQMFRLDGGDVTYVFGVNDRGELQALYWGGKLAPGDKFSAARSLPEMASFDSPGTTPPQG